MADNPSNNQPNLVATHPELPEAVVDPAAATEAQATTAAPEGKTSGESAGFYGGKYESLEAWEQATRHSEQEGARLANRVRELEQERQAIEAQRVNPAQQVDQRRSATEELTEFGIPVDSVRELLREEFAEWMKPQVAINNAMQSVMARRPDFARYRTDVDTWLASHPDVNQRYQQSLASNPDNADMALDWVFDRFTEDRRAAAVTVPTNGSRPPTDASIPVSQAAADRSGNPAGSNETLERAAQYALQYKDFGPYGRERLKEVLNTHPDLPKVG